MHHAIEKHYVADNSFNTLFLPGLPGKYKERPLTADLKALGSNIYTVCFPGTNGKAGEVTPDSVLHTIQTAISELNDTKKPLLMIAYSFSTQYLLQVTASVNDPLGFIFFSPNIDLKHNSIDDFYDIAKRINNTDGTKINAEAFVFNDTWQAAVNHYYTSLDAMTQTMAPAIFVTGLHDKVVKADLISDAIQKYRNSRRYNSLSLISLDKAGHHLDEQYSNGEVRRFLYGIVFAHKLAMLRPQCAVYLWGAALNYRYANRNSDIDLIILDTDFTYEDYIVLNQTVNSFNSLHSVEIDIIVNTFEELKTKEKIRSNRGPSFIHELEYYYFPLRLVQPFVCADITEEDIKSDAAFANEMNIYKSKKALLNYPPASKSSNWIMKDFLIGCIYAQYQCGNLLVDQNNIESYYTEKDPIVKELLDIIRTYKQADYEQVNLSFLKRVLEAHERLSN